ncbi:Uncharacterised protein [Mycobacteroides abscessus subsp. abscessus]|nr:Uncharacterised protein [Mycobacteroides abscessus subsp. abscessus]SIJ94726.1 Uncharacterised protein [Mycobacteroides abscessus subsp. abscessus]
MSATHNKLRRALRWRPTWLRRGRHVTLADLSNGAVYELAATLWNDELAQRFPHADHTACLSLHSVEDGVARWVKCVDWHCNRCGSPTNTFGGHDCPDRP